MIKEFQKQLRIKLINAESNNDPKKIEFQSKIKFQIFL